jgi:hypothetical protein
MPESSVSVVLREPNLKRRGDPPSVGGGMVWLPCESGLEPGTAIEVSWTGCIGLCTLGSGDLKSGCPGRRTPRALERMVPTKLDSAGETGLFAAASSSSVGWWDQPNGRCGVGGARNVFPVVVYVFPGVVDLWELNVPVLRRLIPSHSYCGAPFSLTGARLSWIFSSCIRFNSSSSLFWRIEDSLLTMAAVPLMASALGSVSDCGCSAMVWI